MAVFYYLLVCFIKLSLVECLKWTHHVVLDRDSMFHLLWTPNQDTITFELQVSLAIFLNNFVEKQILIIMYLF